MKRVRKTATIAAIAIALLVTRCPAAQTVTQPFQGITLIHRTETSPRPLDIQVAIIDTLAPGIRFATTPESPYSNDMVVSQTTRQFMTQVGAQLAINGDFYSSPGSFGGYSHRNPSSFAASQGNVYSPFSSTEPAFNIGKNNVAHAIVASSQTAAGKLLPNPAVPIWNAVGGWAYLISNGTLPTYWNNPSDGRYAMANALHPRTAMGLSADRSRIALFVVDGRQSHSGGMNFPEMANMLLNDYGMHWAINLDGGGSTTMAMADPSPHVLNSPSDGSERLVGNSLAVFARPAPPAIPASALAMNYQQQSGSYSHTAAQITSAIPTTNDGAATSIRVGYDATQGRSRGVFSFDLSAIPTDVTIHSVSLTLDAFSNNGASGNKYVDLELFKLTDTVVENQVTWNQSETADPWMTPGGEYSPTSLSSLFGQQSVGLKTFVSTVDFVAAAQVAHDTGTALNLMVAALDAESSGQSTGTDLQLRFRSDDATSGQRPQLTIRYTPYLGGDYNDNDAVDAADYVVWRNRLNQAVTLPNDKTPGTVNSTDFGVWQSRFGNTDPNGAALTAVPEPPTVLVLAVAVAALLSAGNCRRGVRSLRSH